MAELKTKPTQASVKEFLSQIPDEQRREDCIAVAKIMEEVTGEKPKMWGPSIVGYGSYRYTYESGRTGEMCLAGFAIRSRELVVYLLSRGKDQEARLARLGKHKKTKSCLYFKRLADLDMKILEELVANSVRDVKRPYGVR